MGDQKTVVDVTPSARLPFGKLLQQALLEVGKHQQGRKRLDAAQLPPGRFAERRFPECKKCRPFPNGFPTDGACELMADDEL